MKKREMEGIEPWLPGAWGGRGAGSGGRARDGGCTLKPGRWIWLSSERMNER